MRNTLIAALVACSDGTVKTSARRFLEGLSCDELQFIAEFLGACILESSILESADEIVRIAEAVVSANLRRDQDDKVLVLREFVKRCGNLPALSSASRVS